MITRRMTGFLALAFLLPLLACAPFFSDANPSAANATLAGALAWQCPTASPIPTRIIGYDDGGPVGTGTPTPKPEPIYSTPVPTATPYIRTGTDYYVGQRIQVGPIRFFITNYRSLPSATAGQALHLIDLQVENETTEPQEVHFEILSIIRTIKRPDGRAIEGSWNPSDSAARAGGVSFPNGIWPAGTSTATLAYEAPEGQAQQWGMAFVDSNTRRSGSIGDGYVWFRLEDDKDCDRGPGGWPMEAQQPRLPPPTPQYGSGGWPVPLETSISRGYGCHSFYTGVHGDCPAGMWWHDGVGFAAPKGTPLFATKDFHILYAGADSSPMDCSWIEGAEDPKRGFGLYVKASDSDGYTYWYGHTSRPLVSAGQTATSGQQIALMGSTGCSTGSHLHFRVRLNGLDRNPFDVIKK